MKKTGDIIIDTVLRVFGDVIQCAMTPSGRGFDIETCLQSAISLSRTDLYREHHICEAEIRGRIEEEREKVNELCRQTVLEWKKRARLLEIRKTGVSAILDDFKTRTGLPLDYKVRDNYSVGFCVMLQPRQFIKFNASFTKVLTPGWLDEMEKDVRELLAISSRLGRLMTFAVAK